MENSQGDIPDSTSILRTIFEKEIAREKNRIRQRHNRMMRKKREVELQRAYDQLKINYETLELNLNLMYQQSKMHEAKANEYKRICEILIDQLGKKHFVPNPVECIEIEECTIESDNEIINEANTQ